MRIRKTSSWGLAKEKKLKLQDLEKILVEGSCALCEICNKET